MVKVSRKAGPLSPPKSETFVLALTPNEQRHGFEPHSEGNDKDERDENVTGLNHSELGAQSHRGDNSAANTILQIYRSTGIGLHLHQGRRGALGPYRVGSSRTHR